jgi:hypothetical protein
MKKFDSSVLVEGFHYRVRKGFSEKSRGGDDTIKIFETSGSGVFGAGI